MFTGIMLCSIADMALDVLGCFTLVYVNEIPLWITYAVNNLFFCFQIIIPVLMCSYVIHVAGQSYSSKPGLIALLIPAAVFLGLQFINPFTHLIFEITEIDGSLQYARGILFMTLYISEFFYLAVVVALVIYFRNSLSAKQKGTILLFVFVIVSASLFQMVRTDLLLTGMAMTISIMLMDMILQNPEDMLDSASRVFNGSALEVFLNASLSRGKQIMLTVVDIDGLDVLDRGSGAKADTILEAAVGKFLLKLSKTGTWAFRLSKSRFFIIAKDKEELERHSNAVIERFKKKWKVGNVSIDLLAKVICVETNTSIQFSGSEMIALIDETIALDNTRGGHKAHLVIDSTLLARLRRRHIIEESIRRSFKTGEGLYLCFQPIISTTDKSLIAAEALLRYNDPNLGAVSPVEFIPIVEKCGMASFIDTYVITEGCKFLCRHPEVKLLHINLSAAEFYHNPAQMISSIVETYDVDPSRICLEITESSAATHPEILLDFMTEMNAKGFRFALDDYGTGFANVLQVLKLPFRDIKIDKSLLADNAKCRTFLASTIKMFLQIGFIPVVEGVETTEQLKVVTDLGATTIQGFLFSPPLVEADYIRFINNRNE
ncbi:MAG: EAL domain-containing protein [Sphaerochaetaceae bacterium]|nr:EAL domain-containing protein [Sphaerochaetaceae bacterium]